MVDQLRLWFGLHSLPALRYCAGRNPTERDILIRRGGSTNGKDDEGRRSDANR